MTAALPRTASRGAALLVLIVSLAPRDAAAAPPDDSTLDVSEATTTVTLRLSPPEASVTLDGSPLEPSARTVELDPGTHQFVISAPGFITRQETLWLKAQPGREILMSVNLTRDPAEIKAPLELGAIDRLEESARPRIGWGLTAAGAVLIAASVTLAARSTRPEQCTSERDPGCQRPSNPAAWASFTGALGGASLLGGLGLLNWSSLAGDPDSSELTERARPATARAWGVSWQLQY